MVLFYLPSCRETLWPQLSGKHDFCHCTNAVSRFRIAAFKTKWMRSPWLKKERWTSTMPWQLGNSTTGITCDISLMHSCISAPLTTENVRIFLFQVSQCNRVWGKKPCMTLQNILDAITVTSSILCKALNKLKCIELYICATSQTLRRKKICWPHA